MAKQTEIVYSAVDITDFDLSDDLTTGARLISFGDVRNAREYALVGNFSAACRHLAFPSELDDAERYHRKSVTCPRNGAVIVGVEQFNISLFSTSPVNQYGDWELFGHKGVELQGFTRKTKVPSDGVLGGSYKRSLLRLKACLKSESGYVQFYCRPSYLNMQNRRYLQGDLLNVFILKSQQSVGLERYPSIIPVFPETKQTWVAIKSGQILQLILPLGSKIATDDRATSMRLVNVEPSLNKAYDCFYFRCNGQRKRLEAIWYSLPNKYRGVVALPGFEMGTTGQQTPVIQCPASNSTIYCNGHKSLIFRTLEPFETVNDWLDRSYKLRVQYTARSKNDITREPFFESEVTIMGKPQLSMKLINLFDRDVCQAI